MRKKNKPIIISITAISSFVVLLLFSYVIIPKLQTDIIQDINNEREKQFVVNNITVIIDYSGIKENEIFENISLTNYKTTAYHALVNCCDVVEIDYGWGIYIKEINGVGVGWIYSINEDPPPNIPSNYFYLMDNDTVNWKHV